MYLHALHLGLKDSWPGHHRGLSGYLMWFMAQEALSLLSQGPLCQAHLRHCPPARSGTVVTGLSVGKQAAHLLPPCSSPEHSDAATATLPVLCQISDSCFCGPCFMLCSTSEPPESVLQPLPSGYGNLPLCVAHTFEYELYFLSWDTTWPREPIPTPERF